MYEYKGPVLLLERVVKFLLDDVSQPIKDGRTLI